MTARVLVVDDIQANVKLLDARLSAEYFEVLTAYSGREALDILARERVDVVLLDVMMPGIDGFETCRRLKRIEETRDVPVILVTALSDTADRLGGKNVCIPLDPAPPVTGPVGAHSATTLNPSIRMDPDHFPSGSCRSFTSP